MATIELWGRINEAGKLEVDLPDGLPPTEVRVRIDVPADKLQEIPWEQRPWTEEELREAITFHPAKSGAEIIEILNRNSGWWSQQGITDPVHWLDELRRKEEEEHRKW